LKTGAQITGENSKVKEFIKLIDSRSLTFPQKEKISLINRINSLIYEEINDLKAIFNFIGAIFVHSIYKIRDFEFSTLFKDIEDMGFKAILIISVLSFLIGIVIAYQSGVQLAKYGANIFIVDLITISMVRELSPLIVGIILAGRSASSYTAQIGLMKVSEEIDVLDTMGLSPYVILVLPRILSLVIITPLLIVFADFIGVIGGMIISKVSLDVSFNQFLIRIPQALTPKMLISGVLKGPVFGFFIALIGTFEGFQVEKRSESIGYNVINSVVKSIFTIILLDAVFSVVFRWLNI
jgi:phospholipid/cholesterol/gamma-HCH transport system permease protein